MVWVITRILDVFHAALHVASPKSLVETLANQIAFLVEGMLRFGRGQFTTETGIGRTGTQ